MNVIVPMAGMGKRLRPHTLTTPKPLLPVAGKPIVQRLVEDIVSVSHLKIREIAYVVGRFGEDVENHLIQVAEELGAKGSIHYQDEPLGTAHAILCAATALNGPVTVAFADTLFRADFTLDTSKDGVLWVQQIDDPSQFGVVIVNEDGVITDFQEKPKEFVSDLAMIGIYYFNDGEWLRRELQYLIDERIMNSGEYQLPDALRNMVKKGARFTPGRVDDWMDCGNKDAVVQTNAKVLSYGKPDPLSGANSRIEHSTIHPSTYIGQGCTIRNSEIGAGVSIGAGSHIEDCTILNSVLMNNVRIMRSVISNSIAGNHTIVNDFKGSLSLGDFSQLNCHH